MRFPRPSDLSSPTSSPRSMRSRLRRGALAVAFVGFAVIHVGCGGSGPYYYSGYGDAYVENQDAVAATVEFYMSPSGSGVWTGDLLGGPLFFGEVAFVGSFIEDYYDAEAVQSDFFVVQFFDEPIFAGDSTTFVVF